MFKPGPKYGKDHPAPTSRRGMFGKIQILILVSVLVFILIKLIHKSSIIHNTELEEQLDDFMDLGGEDSAGSEDAEGGPPARRVICNPRQMLCERRRDTLFDGLHKTDAQELVHRVLTKADYKCRELQRFGHQKDGGYEVCLDKSFKPKAGECLVYSFGVHNDFSFEDHLNKEFGCEVHSFDPSMGKPDHEHAPNMTFHSLGLWGDDFESEEGWKYRRLSTILQMLGHQNRQIDILKINAEGAEWPVFRDIAIDPGQMENVKQLIIAAHAPRRKPRNQTMRMTDYAQVFRSLSMLKRLGFRNYFYHGEDSGACCKWWADLVPATVHKGSQMICCYDAFFINMNFL